MLIKTHYAISVFFILVFYNFVNSKTVFVLAVLFATILPDIDSRFSTIGRRKIARILQVLTKHRGMIHSYSFLLSLTFVLVIFWPTSAFGFFSGYGLHLFTDSFTKEGIRPFYPSKLKARGFIKTGSRFEIFIFVLFLILDVVLVLQKII